MRKKIILILSVLCVLFFVWGGSGFVEYFASVYNSICKKAVLERKEVGPLWINIFVHGTVGTAFSFLDFSSVQQDKIEKSVYKKTVSLLRKNRYFYQDQPIADKGFYRVEPSFEFIKRDDGYFASYPILKAFDELSAFAFGSAEQNVYYLFGWSGYLSQNRRRLEAIRFYNQLAEEVATYEKLGFQPKIRILAHSHGGNLALNLAGIYHSLNSGPETDKFYEKFEIAQYVRDLFDKALATSFEKEVAVVKKGQKCFAYCPEKKNLFVDELVLLGTPIQVETSLFVASPFFGATYNIYSEGDVIQCMDFVSTIKKQSLQRIEGLVLGDTEFHQICVGISPKSGVWNKVFGGKGSKKPAANMWQVIFGLKDTSRKTADPTHKEFWYIVPHDETPFNFLRPLPVVCFFPLIKRLQGKMKAVQDANLEITKVANGFLFRLADKEDSVCESLEVDGALVERLREQLIPWIKPKDSSKIMRGIMSKMIDFSRKFNM